MPIIEKLDALARTRTEDESLAIIDKDDRVHMAHMDIHFTHSTNGVAALHTEILKNSELHGFYELYPEKFNNKTNGITFRRWLLECDPRLTATLEKHIGSGFRKDASELETKEKVDGKNQRTVLSQQEINNSPQQTFSGIAPGDVKYKDQNGDNRIDEKDVVKMFGSSLPRFYFGFNLNFSYKRFELSADFQGMTGVTVSLLDSPLYRPLVDNGNISNTFLNEEVYWTPENKAKATMPRLTTQENQNNYRASSLWYRDGSFLKLRNLLVAYTFPKSQTRFADLQVFVQGTNLFSLDNIHFADPEQLGIAYPSARSYWAGVKLNF